MDPISMSCSPRLNVDTQLDHFNGSWVAGAHSIGASYISPIFGVPGTVNNPDHEHYVTNETVVEAHKLGMKILPWVAVGISLPLFMDDCLTH